MGLNMLTDVRKSVTIGIYQLERTIPMKSFSRKNWLLLLLFGTIASVGINSLMKNKVDLGNTRNLVIASLILTLGIGGAELTFGNFTIGGIGLAALVGVLLNLVIPKDKAQKSAE